MAAKKEKKRPLQLILIRHAESMRNQAKRGLTYFENDESRKHIAGVPDHEIGLTETGKIQAQKTGKYLWDRFGVPDYIYHSGYARTEQTLDGIMEAFSEEEKKKIQIRMSSFIRERDPGYAYDMTKEEAEKAFPYLNAHWKTFGGFFARPPGGESLLDVSERVQSFLSSMFRDRQGELVWLVTHGGTIRAIRFRLEHWPYKKAASWPEGQSPKNCGITVYDFDHIDQRLVLREYNTVAKMS